ncbi:MAG: hypothetical protein ACRDSJ_10805, partial [Rubrobacteraceae bacterium]
SEAFAEDRGDRVEERDGLVGVAADPFDGAPVVLRRGVDEFGGRGGRLNQPVAGVRKRQAAQDEVVYVSSRVG